MTEILVWVLELPEKVAFVNKENIKLAIEFGFSSKLSDQLFKNLYWLLS
jgi:hypothetical protein